MIWIEIVCDGCNYNPWGEHYRRGSIAQLNAKAKECGWKITNGKIYCPECQERMRAKNIDIRK